jgi:hypothetical protein
MNFGEVLRQRSRRKTPPLSIYTMQDYNTQGKDACDKAFAYRGVTEIAE